MDRKKFIFAGVAIALLIAAMAPFIASSNPDGLESAFYSIFGAKEVQGSTLDEEKVVVAEEQAAEITGNTFSFASPFPDYTISGFAVFGEAIAVIIGTLLVLGIAFGIGRFMKRTE
jgi:cobalt/nickel transport protein